MTDGPIATSALRSIAMAAAALVSIVAIASLFPPPAMAATAGKGACGLSAATAPGISAPAAATAAIAAAPATATATASAPTAPEATMRLKGPADAEWTSVTQAFAYRPVDFEAEITLPANVHEYPKYYCEITVSTAGMQIDDGSVVIELDGQDATSNLEGNADGDLQVFASSLNIRLYDLLGVFGDAVGGSVLKASFKASNAPSGADASQVVGRGRISMTYYTNPASTMAYGRSTTPYLTKVFTHSAGITAVDASTGEPLRNKYFAVKVIDCSDADAVGKYVSSNGSVKESRTTFLTGDDGRVNLPGLDSGTYAIEELRAPSGYLAQGEALFTVTAGLDAQELSVSSFTATAEGRGVRVVSADASTWRAEIEVGSGRPMRLPVTGLEEARRSAAASAALATAGLAGAVMLLAARRLGGEGRAMGP